MEIVSDLSNNQLILYIPIAVLIVAVLVFAFGFKQAVQPPFDKLTSDDRKPAGKKRKIKEKKSTANGHVQSGESKQEKSPAKDTKRSPAKETVELKKAAETNKQAEKNKKNEAIKNNKNVVEELKNKKNKQKVAEKPVDFDDGDWETVPTKSDKKKKIEQSPIKKDKKVKKATEKVDIAELEKLAKEVVNKELREKETSIKIEEIIELPKIEVPVKEEPVVIVEEKKEKEKEKKKPKKLKVENVEKVSEKIVEPSNEVQVEAPKKETSKPPKAEKISQPPADATKVAASGAAFDELGDVWTEAKVAKKSKKKARRDN